MWFLPKTLAMKIDFAVSAPLSNSARAGAPRTAPPGFRVPVDAKSISMSEARPAGTVVRMQAPVLIAEIAAGHEREQRRRRHGHAAALLDRLEALKCDIVLGRLESAALEGLQGALSAGGEVSADPVLEALVEAVELRAAVEIAKLKARRGCL